MGGGEERKKGCQRVEKKIMGKGGCRRQENETDEEME